MTEMLPKRLKELREKIGWTQQQLGEKLNVSDATINRYEKGLRNPDPKTLGQLAKIFNVTVDYLLGRDELREKVTKLGTSLAHELDIADEDIKLIIEATLRMTPEEKEKLKQMTKLMFPDKFKDNDDPQK